MGATSFRRSSANFDRAVAELDRAQWRSELIVEEIGSPQRIAPYSIAISGELHHLDKDLGAGRLILLHDPAGNEAWQGTFRCVTFAHAQVGLELVTDSQLPQVGWSWLVDALDNHQAQHLNPAGTVTAVYSQSFGEMVGETDCAEVEIRASWTPLLSSDQPLFPHLLAWQDLLCNVAGLPPLPPGIVTIHPPKLH